MFNKWKKLLWQEISSPPTPSASQDQLVAGICVRDSYKRR